jgi:pimeloyl-ACP methyl ester carboxylesterase
MTMTAHGPSGGTGNGCPALSRWTDIGGPVHYLDFGGPAGGPVVVCVHGLGGCAVTWSAIAPLLTGQYRLLAPDLAGHGLTPSAGRGTDVAANRVLLRRFIETVAGGGPVILLSISMGGMISLLEAAAADMVAGLILIGPVLPFRPTWGSAQMAVRLLGLGLRRRLNRHRRPPTAEDVATEILALGCVDPARVPRDVVAQFIAVARQRADFTVADRELTAAMRSVASTAGCGLAYRRGIRSVTRPVLLLHGSGDRVMPLATAAATARANPAWSLVVLPGVGHMAQLEAPTQTAAAITRWLGSAGLAAPAPESRGRT